MVFWGGQIRSGRGVVCDTVQTNSLAKETATADRERRKDTMLKKKVQANPFF